MTSSHNSEELAHATSIILPLYKNHVSKRDLVFSENSDIKKADRSWSLPRFRRLFRKKRIRSLILIHITHVQQIFNSFDPSPFHERDIDADAEQFITTMAESLSHNQKVDVFQINVHLGTLPTEQEYMACFKKRATDGRSYITINTLSDANESTAGPLPHMVRDSPDTIRKSNPQLPAGAGIEATAPMHAQESPAEFVKPVVMGSIDKNEMIRLLSEDLKVTLQNHFAFQAELVKNEIQRVISTGRTAAVLGFMLMLISLTLSKLVASIPHSETDAVPIVSILSNALEILAWVSWWRPIEMILYSWWPLAVRRRLLDKLSRCDLRVFFEPHAEDDVVVRPPVRVGGKPSSA